MLGMIAIASDGGKGMRLLNSINHLTFITADMDRLIAFYQRNFEAWVHFDLTEDELRHVAIEVGPDKSSGDWNV
jgi:hypothetical protein